jgi:uncharacterized membrane protein (UPF0136 family)
MVSSIERQAPAEPTSRSQRYELARSSRRENSRIHLHRDRVERTETCPETHPMLGSSPLIAPITLGIYAVLLGVGGLIGYLKAGSRPSLIAGSISALVALVALGLSLKYKNYGIVLGLLLSISLFILFGYRYAVKTQKFMPSGLLAVVSLVVLAVMFLIMDWTQS